MGAIKYAEGTPDWNRVAWKTMTIDKGYEAAVRWAAKAVERGKPRYLEVCRRMRWIPDAWWIIGCLHMKEASCDFGRVLHNGQTLVHVNKYGTTIKPLGRGKGLNWTWEDAAVDALTLNGSRWREVAKGNLELGLIFWSGERYNGTGYISGAGKDETTPYNWAMTSINDDFGKYTSDGKFDPKAPTNKAAGFAAIVKDLELRGVIKTYCLDPVDLAAAAPRAELIRGFTGILSADQVDDMIDRQAESRPGCWPTYWAAVDFRVHSGRPRLHVLNRKTGVLTSHLCSHGIGSEGASDDGYADRFSNVPGSKASSLGLYRTAETYTGKHGLSLRLDGLDPSNSNVRARAIVIHGAEYVSDTTVRRHGRVGRSEGCFALPTDEVREVISNLKGGSLLLAID